MNRYRSSPWQKSSVSKWRAGRPDSAVASLWTANLAETATGRADADQMTQKQPEVATRDMDQHPFQNVRMPPQVHPPHAPRVV